MNPTECTIIILRRRRRRSSRCLYVRGPRCTTRVCRYPIYGIYFFFQPVSHVCNKNKFRPVFGDCYACLEQHTRGRGDDFISYLRRRRGTPAYDNILYYYCRLVVLCVPIYYPAWKTFVCLFLFLFFVCVCVWGVRTQYVPSRFKHHVFYEMRPYCYCVGVCVCIEELWWYLPARQKKDAANGISHPSSQSKTFSYISFTNGRSSFNGSTDKRIGCGDLDTQGPAQSLGIVCRT